MWSVLEKGKVTLLLYSSTNFLFLIVILVLKEIPNDKDALHCKVVCLIQQSLFSEALDVVLSIERKG